MTLRPARRILVYRIGQIGDTVLALPSLWALRNQFPDARITLLSDRQPDARFPSARAVLPEEGLIDDWISYPASVDGTSTRGIRDAVQQIRAGRFDLLVYLSPRVRSRVQILRDRAFFYGAGVFRHIGFSGLDSSRSVDLVTGLVENEADHLLRRLRLGGIQTPPPREGSMDLQLNDVESQTAGRWLKANVPSSQGAHVAAICTGGKWPAQHWPVDRYEELGRRLHNELGIYPVIFGGPEDAPTAAKLIDRWGVGASAAGQLSIRESAAAIARCRLYVGNDTGVMHLAAAVGTPCVAIFSSRDLPGQYYPYGRAHVVLRTEVPCQVCRLRTCEKEQLRCLRAITVSEVVTACRRVVTGSIEPRRHPVVTAA